MVESASSTVWLEACLKYITNFVRQFPQECTMSIKKEARILDKYTPADLRKELAGFEQEV